MGAPLRPATRTRLSTTGGPQTVADRRVLNVLKPDDLTREQVCDLAVQFIPAVRKVCVVREPHKRIHVSCFSTYFLQSRVDL